jgi:alpha,alpha-trehalase
MLRRPLFPSQISRITSCFLLLLCLLTPVFAAPTAPQQNIQSYISSGWNALTRSLTNCSTVVDPKVAAPSVLYLPADFPVPAAVRNLQKKCRVEIKHLPAVIHGPGEVNPDKINPPGLLYLPNKYVVPGGRFNEMYGWDSYFIILGLIRDGRLDLARGMVDNFFFEIEHYGAVLNANRTYYLTRSQPPFLTSMILTVYDAEKAQDHDDRAWLARAYRYAVRDYSLWTHPPHLNTFTGLSCYHDFGSGPAPESLHGEPGYYRGVAAYFLAHPDAGQSYIVEQNQPGTGLTPAGPGFQLKLCDPGSAAQNSKPHPACDPVTTVFLTSGYYKGDRAMRESGFDISFRFGPYGAATEHYAAVGLNSLLFKTETDLAYISDLLGNEDAAAQWRAGAAARKKNIDEYLWNAQRGMFFDYNTQNVQQSTYEYATTFYPLWAGLATPQQAQAVDRNLKIFEQPGGLAMSTRNTGAQWDYPYGWAPIQLLAIEGLRRYGFNNDANRLSTEFLSMIIANYQRDGTIREKYNVVTRSYETNVAAGYKSNVIGFGWTNGVFLQLLHELPPNLAQKVEQQERSAPVDR